MRRFLGAALVVAALALSGCSGGGVPGPGKAEIDVDTPQLRQIKSDAGIETCVPGQDEPGSNGLPEVTLPCLGGGHDVDLSTLKGPLIVNLWAAWCGPCRKEMPALADFYQRYGDQVPVIGVDYQDPQTGPALELAYESGVTYPLLADPQGDLQAAAPFPAKIGMPTFAFVKADGQVDLAAGGVDSVAEVRELVSKHLGVDL